MIKPMLARDHPNAFEDDNYIWETKYDGARILANANKAGFELQSRSGRDKTKQFPELVFNTRVPAILDGEVVCYDEHGRSIFNSIQSRVNRTKDIPWAVDAYPVVFEVFDILEAQMNGTMTNLRHQTLEDRKRILEKVLEPTDNVRKSEYVIGDGISLFNDAKSRQLEGVIGKHLKSRYQEGAREWLKVKVWQIGTFLVVGYTAGTGWREKTFGALVLSDMKGEYVGAVGTGFNDAEIGKLMTKFVPASCPFPREPEPATWVRPFAVKIRYLEYTNDGQLRFPSYKGMVK